MDVVFYAGLDDTQLQAKLATAQKGITKALGGIPGQIGGAGKAVGAFAGSLGGAVGILTAVGGLTYKWFQHQEQVAEEAARTRKELAAAASEAGRAAAASTAGGFVSAFGSDDAQKRAAVLRKVDEIRSVEEKRIQAEFESAKASKQSYDVYVQRQKVEEGLQQIREKLLANLDQELALSNAAESSRLRAASFTAQQADAEASVVEEMQRHADEARKIEALARDRPGDAAALAATESARHSARMDEIRAEELGRQAAAEQKAAKADEERIAQEERARLIDLELEKQQALIDGDKKRADAIDRVLDHERRLAELRKLEVSDATRASLIEKENRLFAAGGQSTNTNNTRSAGVGFVNQGALSLAALGGGPQVELQREQVGLQKNTNIKLDQLINETRRRSGGAVYA